MHNQPIKFKILTVLAIASAITGCANNYAKFYKPENGMTAESIALMRASLAPTAPLVERIPPTDGAAARDAYLKRGYVMIGSTEFNSTTTESENSAIEHGKAIGADLVVILNAQYLGSEQSIIPITTPTTSTTYSTSSATAYGRSGSVTAYGSGTSTTYGTATNYMPITSHRTGYGAGYFIKQKIVFGAHFRNLSDKERTELQTNRGATIHLIADESPAFKADLFPGDIATSLDGIQIFNTTHITELITARKGNRILLRILRDGRSLDVPIQLNP